MRSITVRVSPCSRERTQRSRSASRERGTVEVAGPQVLGVRVEDEERVRVPERQHELAHRLADRVGREPVAGPGLLRAQVVPAEGVGAVGVEDRPRVDDVAAALRHLLAVGVGDQPEADAVLVARRDRRPGSPLRAASRTSRGSGRAPRRCSRRETATRTLRCSRTDGGTARTASSPSRTRRRSSRRPDASRAPHLSHSTHDVVDVRTVQVVGHLAAALAQLGDEPAHQRSSQPVHSQIGSGVPQ